MNTLEVTYADKAGRLIEGSPDKTKIEELQAQVQALQGKSLKIYYIEDENIDAEHLADVKGLLDSLTSGEYQAVHLKVDMCTYYVVDANNGKDDIYVQLINISNNKLRSYFYSFDTYTNAFVLEEDNSVTFTFTLEHPKPGTKLYYHEISLKTGTDILNMGITTDKSTPITTLSSLYETFDFGSQNVHIRLFKYAQHGGSRADKLGSTGNPEGGGAPIAFTMTLYASTSYPGGNITFRITNSPTLSCDLTTGAVTHTNNIAYTQVANSSSTITDTVTQL